MEAPSLPGLATASGEGSHPPTSGAGFTSRKPNGEPPVLRIRTGPTPRLRALISPWSREGACLALVGCWLPQVPYVSRTDSVEGSMAASKRDPSSKASYDQLIERQRSEWRTTFPAALERLGWPAERLADERDRRLVRLISWAKQRSPFHRERLRSVEPSALTAADLTSLPAMTKDDLMDNFQAIVTDSRLTLNVVNDHIDRLSSDAYLLDQYHAIATGGSTGRRGLFVYGWDEWITLAQLFRRWWSRRAPTPPAGPAGVTALLHADKASHISAALGALTADSARPTLRLPMTLSLSKIVVGLNEAQPSGLGAYPSALDLLVGEVRAGRLRIAPSSISTCGELLTEETREAVRDLWGVEIVDFWGASEGVYAFPCEQDRAMHWPDDLAIIEPVDEDGQPVPAGRPAAKILLTNLYNLTQPLIRYEITDAMTLLAEPCPCGCAHRRIGHLTGRLDDAFRYADDILVHPIVFRSPLGRDRHIVEYQVTQTLTGASIAVCADADADLEILRRRIISRLGDAGLRDAEITVTRVPSLSRQATGKLRRFVPLPATTPPKM